MEPSPPRDAPAAALVGNESLSQPPQQAPRVRHSWLELSAEALRHNYRLFAAMLGEKRLAPVVKANAYGHGLAEVYTALAPLRPRWLAVNDADEGVALRRMGYGGRLLVVGPALPEDLSLAYAEGLELVVGNPVILRLWLERREKPQVHIKFNTGMGRQGFMPQDARALADVLMPHQGRLVGLCTHFANVEDVSETSYADKQLALLAEARQVFDGAGFRLLAHAASSASTLIMAASHLDLCRVGLALYGLWPSRLTRLSYAKLHGSLAELRPALAWRSRLTSVRELAAGEYVGYGCSFRASHAMRVGVVAAGYYEGYPRLATSHGRSYVLIQGQRCAVVGRVCMNMLMVDVTDLAQPPRLGERVTLLGSDGGPSGLGHEQITAEEFADWAQTINYELVTRLNSALPRRLV